MRINSGDLSSGDQYRPFTRGDFYALVDPAFPGGQSNTDLLGAYVPLPEATVQSVAALVDAMSVVPAGPHGHAHWDARWGRQGDRAFGGAEFDLDLLRPSYYGQNAPLRLAGRYVLPDSAALERRWHDAYLDYLMANYFSRPEVRAVYEFGCGPGYNLAYLALKEQRRAPQKIGPRPKQKVYRGSDWSFAAATCVNQVAAQMHLPLAGDVYDMLQPQPLVFPEGTAVFTLGAMEQLGTGWRPFIDALVRAKPVFVVHVEPIVEWCQTDRPIGRVAAAYHRKRGYWEGFPDYLNQLLVEGKVEVLDTQAVRFGSTFIEGYNRTVWRPL